MAKVQITSVVVSHARPATTPPPSSDERPLSLRAILGGAVTALVLSVASFAGLFGEPSTAIGAFIFGGGLPLCAGLGLIGLAFWELRRRTKPRADPAVMNAVLNALRSTTEPITTVEWLTQRLQQPDSTIIAALLTLVSRDQVSEELNEDNGDWYYTPVSAEGNLEARWSTIQRQNR